MWALGYPFGNAATVTGRDLRLAEQAGFRRAFMNAGGGFGAKINRFALPCVHVTADMSLAEFEAHISGFYRSLRKKLLGGDELEAWWALETERHPSELGWAGMNHQLCLLSASSVILTSTRTYPKSEDSSGFRNRQDLAGGGPARDSTEEGSKEQEWSIGRRNRYW